MEVEFVERYIAEVPVFELKGMVMGGMHSLAFSERLNSIIEAGEKHIIVDLGGVHWMNSAGIGVLISGVRRLRERGGDLHLADLSKKVAHYFKVTKLDSVLSIYVSVDRAVECVRQTNMAA